MGRYHITKEEVQRAYDEIERRVQLEIKDGAFKWEDEINEYRGALLQGLYGTLKVLSDNWCEVSRWCYDLEDQAYWKRLGYEED